MSNFGPLVSVPAHRSNSNNASVSAASAPRKKQCRSKSCVRSRKRRRGKKELDDSRPTHQPSPHPYHRRPVSTFERYIHAQGWLPEEDVYAFFSALRRPLPICFRIRSKAEGDEWGNLLHNSPSLRGLDATRVLTDANAWQIASHLDDFPVARAWISRATERGAVSRQEFVSMIPVHLLNVQSHQKVLDMCASPGSKTIQALDGIYDSPRCSLGQQPSGFVVANEIDSKRAYVLAHRSRNTLQERMTSLAIVTHNACKFPDALAPCRRSDSRKRDRVFDRIICDVPCSGDGTLRKDFKVWKTWHPSYGVTLHSIQVRIAKRGIALCKIGGYMTYSTCSFHPIENEAVVAALLATGCVELASREEIDARMEGIVYRKGLTSWRVLNDECCEVQPAERPIDWPLSLWPPCDEAIIDSLPRCVRIVPQDNDTGGFFIALLKKVREYDVSGKKSKAKKNALVTPQAPFHQLRQVNDVGGARLFSRSPSGAVKAKHFKIASNLAEYLHDSTGSSKLNLVYAGAI